MTTKVNGRKTKTTSVCMMPEQARYAHLRAEKAKITFSRYVQALISYDQAHGILGRALTLNLETP